MIWVLIGLFSFAALPWYFLQQGSLLQALFDLAGNPENASALFQVTRYQRPWLVFGLLGLSICLLSLVWPAHHSARRRGLVLVGGALIGLLGLLVSGFAIGPMGWSFDVLEHSWGPLAQGQFGMGWGAAAVLFSLIVDSNTLIKWLLIH